MPCDVSIRIKFTGALNKNVKETMETSEYVYEKIWAWLFKTNDVVS